MEPNSGKKRKISDEVSESDQLKNYVTNVDETIDIVQSPYTIIDKGFGLRAKIYIFTDVEPLSSLVEQLKKLDSTRNADIEVYPLDEPLNKSMNETATGRNYVTYMVSNEKQLCNAVREGDDDDLWDIAAEGVQEMSDNNFIMTVLTQDLSIIGICYGFFNDANFDWYGSNEDGKFRVDLNPLINIELFCGTPSFKGVGQIMMNMLKLIVLVQAKNDKAFTLNSITLDTKTHDNIILSMSDEFPDGLPTEYSIFLKSVHNTFTQSFYIKSGFILIQGLPMDDSIPYIWFLESYLTYAASMLYKEYIPFYGPSSGKLPADTALPDIMPSILSGPDDYYSMIPERRTKDKKQKIHNIEAAENLLKNGLPSTLGGKKTRKMKKIKKTHFCLRW